MNGTCTMVDQCASRVPARLKASAASRIRSPWLWPRGASKGRDTRREKSPGEKCRGGCGVLGMLSRPWENPESTRHSSKVARPRERGGGVFYETLIEGGKHWSLTVRAGTQLR